MADSREIVAYLEDLLRHKEVPDRYCPNGLQVEGRVEVSRVGFAVDACLQSFQALEGCHLILVHHGLFWPSAGRVTGSLKERLAHLLQRDTGLFASHLPLDKHPNLGNNAQLLKLVGLTPSAEFGEVGWVGEFEAPVSRQELHERLQAALGSPVRMLGFGKEKVLRIGVSSGAGSLELLSAARAGGVDLVFTGETSHPMYHGALEAGMNVALGGHYATETWGLKALMPRLEEAFGVSTLFADFPTGF